MVGILAEPRLWPRLRPQANAECGGKTVLKAHTFHEPSECLTVATHGAWYHRREQIWPLLCVSSSNVVRKVFQQSWQLREHSSIDIAALKNIPNTKTSTAFQTCLGLLQQAPSSSTMCLQASNSQGKNSNPNTSKIQASKAKTLTHKYLYIYIYVYMFIQACV